MVSQLEAAAPGDCVALVVKRKGIDARECNSDRTRISTWRQKPVILDITPAL